MFFKLKAKKSMLPEFIAHAGGGYNGMAYTNSIEALNENTPYYEWFEMDFLFTSDGELVCGHDWTDTFFENFGIRPDGPLTLKEFEELTQKNEKYTNCTAYILADWMRKNPDKLVVADVKENNVAALEYLSEKFPDIKQRFIAQVYDPSEYDSVKALGYEKVIWTLYRYDRINDHRSVIKEAAEMWLLAVAMPDAQAEDGLASKLIKALSIPSFVHTVNSRREYAYFKKLGVHGVFTDSLR